MTPDRLLHGIIGAVFGGAYIFIKKPYWSLGRKAFFMGSCLLGTWVPDRDLFLRIGFHRSPFTHSAFLTSKGSDHGCDIVVFGHGETFENILIQCKSTRKNTLDSEVAIREIVGAKPFFESHYGITFDRACDIKGGF